MTKEELRDKLFDRHFECKDGILITDLMELVKPIIEVYRNLKKLLVEHKTIKLFSNINQVKLINHNNKEYLFLKKSSGWSYLIIDLETSKVLEKQEISNQFDEQIFIKNFQEVSTELDEEWTDLYYFLKYDGEVKILIDFYNQNKKILNIDTAIFNKLYVDQAWTWLWISLISGEVQLSFQTEDQFLYECLFLKSDLTPSAMQDATEKIGKEKMLEMLDRIKEIRIPKELIPKELLESFSKFSTSEEVVTSKVNQKKVGVFK